MVNKWKATWQSENCGLHKTNTIVLFNINEKYHHVVECVWARLMDWVKGCMEKQMIMGGGVNRHAGYLDKWLQYVIKRADLPFGDGTVLHNDVLLVRPTAPENNNNKKKTFSVNRASFSKPHKHLKSLCHPCGVFFHLKSYLNSKCCLPAHIL